MSTVMIPISVDPGELRELIQGSRAVFAAQFVRALVDDVHAPTAEDRQVVLHGMVGEHLPVLRHIGDSQRNRILGTVNPDQFAIDFNRSRILGREAENRLGEL